MYETLFFERGREWNAYERIMNRNGEKEEGKKNFTKKYIEQSFLVH